MTTSRWSCLVALASALAVLPAGAAGADPQPVAIFHAFDQPFRDVEGFVCVLAEQGYSHVQLSPVQRSNPTARWWARYQPVDLSVIEGLGSEADLRRLVKKAHGCGVKVIVDVVLNHMANMPEYAELGFPGLGRASFHPKCPTIYDDGNRDTEVRCWLGDLPDLDHARPEVTALQRRFLRRLVALGVDGFRFDAAKHMPREVVRDLLAYVNERTGGRSWNYLEVIEDHDTRAEDYNDLAAVTDFLLYRSMKAAFSYGGDLRALRVAGAVPDPRSVTFSRNHDTIRELNDQAIDPYADRTDTYLAAAFVLARQAGTPLVLNWDNLDSPLVRTGVKFRQVMSQRAAEGRAVAENVLAVVDSPTLLVMERGEEGFLVVNKAKDPFEVPELDLTLTNLEGCYHELRSARAVAIERRDGKKTVTRWGSPGRRGMRVEGRDALFFVRAPWSECDAR